MRTPYTNVTWPWAVPRYTCLTPIRRWLSWHARMSCIVEHHACTPTVPLLGLWWSALDTRMPPAQAYCMALNVATKLKVDTLSRQTAMRAQRLPVRVAHFPPANGCGHIWTIHWQRSVCTLHHVNWHGESGSPRPFVHSNVSSNTSMCCLWKCHVSSNSELPSRWDREMRSWICCTQAALFFRPHAAYEGSRLGSLVCSTRQGGAPGLHACRLPCRPRVELGTGTEFAWHVRPTTRIVQRLRTCDAYAVLMPRT